MFCILASDRVNYSVSHNGKIYHCQHIYLESPFASYYVADLSSREPVHVYAMWKYLLLCYVSGSTGRPNGSVSAFPEINQVPKNN